MTLSVERLKQLLHYNPETGAFLRLVATNNRAKVGERAGFVDSDGYRRIRVDGKLYLAHRLAWLAETGLMPEDEIDHANGVRDDNSWANLRPASRSQNSVNRFATNKTGFRGVSLKGGGRYEAAITVAGKRIFLGSFDSAESAHSAYVRAGRRLHGEFARPA